LVRELNYDFRDWQSIEATGKGGDDDGFDIRAYERTTTTTVDDEGNEVLHPMDGNVWMIQGSVAKFGVVASTDCHGCSERGSQALNLIRD